MSVPRPRLRSEDVARVLRQMPGGSLLLCGPRAVAHARSTRRRIASAGADDSAYLSVPATIPLAAAAFVDELTLAALQTRGRTLGRAEIVRTAGDLREAVSLFRDEGWLDDPVAFHRRPPPPTKVSLRRVDHRGVEFERLAFDSEYDPDPRIPGAARWLGQERNRRARAFVVRARSDEPRPWLVLLHGYGMGHARDVRAFRSIGFRDHGVNVIHPVFPMHGPRRLGRRSGEGVISFDAMTNVHGLAQAVWDTRRCISWARSQGATAVAVHGFSLGAYTAALLAGVENDLACVIAGAPPADLVTLLARNTSPRARAVARDGGLLGEEIGVVHRVVSPLAVRPRVPRDRRFIYAGVGDRISTVSQAELLWSHWDRPAILWFVGGHVAAPWTRAVHRFVRGAIASSTPGGAGAFADRERA